MPLQATSGAASYDAFGGATPAVPNYIEEVFSTYLYTGNGSTQTITNGIDLSTKGGMVITKARSIAYGNILVDTTRGVGNILQTSTTNAQIAESTAVTGVSTTGFSVGSYSNTNGNGQTFASWTFRKQPKFFDVVTWTGNTTSTSGTVYRQLSHSLASTVGTIIVKRTSSTGSWPVYHRSLPTSGDAGGYLFLNTTGGLNYTSGYFPTAGYVGSNGVTSTYNSSVFTVGDDINQTGSTYVAYLFAHDAGGFGLTGTDNVISCGSYTGNGSATGPIVTLGYEPQWLMIKNSSAAGSWFVIDVMRGFSETGFSVLLADNSAGEASYTTLQITPTATGFKITNTTSAAFNASGNTYIYIAIRRGPMKVPTSGTSVFSPNNGVTTSAFNVGFPNDWALEKRPNATFDWYVGTRLTGNDRYLVTNSTGAEQANTSWSFDGNTNFFRQLNDDPALVYSFRRAPGFFDVVCYTGTGANRNLSHNLQAVPELIICKTRGTVNNWIVYCSLLNTPAQNRLVLNGTFGQLTTPNATWWNSTNPTSSVFSLSGDTGVNGSGQTQVAYLFATCTGVSKVGSYTGTGASGNAITTGFSPRFLMIKCTSTTGNWIVFDTARGMGAGSDPYLLLNTTGAEGTGTDWLDVSSSGFSLNTTGNATNGSGQTYIYLAIA